MSDTKPNGGGGQRPAVTADEIKEAVMRRKAMVKHALSVLAGQGVKPIWFLSVEDCMHLLDCEPIEAARVLDLASVAMEIDYKEFLTPFLDRVRAGETMEKWLVTANLPGPESPDLPQGGTPPKKQVEQVEKEKRAAAHFLRDVRGEEEPGSGHA